MSNRSGTRGKISKEDKDTLIVGAMESARRSFDAVVDDLVDENGLTIALAQEIAFKGMYRAIKELRGA